MKLIYSREAVADLTRLRHFIAENNPSVAARIAAELIARIDNLRAFPQVGIKVLQAPPPAEVRDMVFGDYIVRYSIHTQAIVILRLWHHYEERESGY